ncbi:DUF1735 domain-containing protein [Pedobacter riviphilus]|uniref:DUF1735 domain-containing protein n=1 Tax=Pedobacter riviphilus TaxID=2766984 RepID=A0ABX6TPJ5_9SPHI|nr:DUF5627 domain-containing protein [Pedobacter riviphilus]QNR85170.1 DUF1735 domain-containing protein [Pedobacter riviphilus]
MKRRIIFLLAISILLGSCKNQDWEFPDYGTQTVYFAYQSPVRTITLGEDIYDTSLDNLHRCEIMATTGGVYEVKNDISIGVAVDNALASNLSFGGAANVVAMPANYYNLLGSAITISKGKIAGGVQVQLTDAFFADPLALKNTYVIPLRMTSVQNADKILEAKNYTLYAIKYINPWHGYYLRRGKDIITGKNGNTSLNKTVSRHMTYVESDEVNQVVTTSLKSNTFDAVFKDKDNRNITCKLLLTFDNSGNCTVSAADNTFTASGNGKFIKRGEKNSWGNTDRDALYLNYNIDLTDMSVNTTDTLVMRNRGVTMETFNPVKK